MLVTAPRPGLVEIVRQAVAGGVNAVQVRDGDPARALEAARVLREVALPPCVLLVNRWVEVAREAGADGVHLPEDCPGGGSGFTGRSVHSVEAARASDADYLIAGTVFPSASHPDRTGQGLGYLRAVCAAVSVPVVAIGGVTPGRVAACLRVGAAGVAVLSGILDAEDPQAAAERYASALSPPQSRCRGMGG